MLLDRIFQYLPASLSAWCLGRSARHYHKADHYPTLLVMNRGRLSLDIAELIARAPLNIITIKALRYKVLLARFVAKPDQVQTHFQRHYLQDDPLRRRKMQKLASQMLDGAAAGRRIDGVLVANVDYWPDEALKDICAERGIGFFVLGRENYAHADSGEYLAARFREYAYEFRGTAIAMASDASRDAMRQGRIAAPETIETTGWPRFDGWHDDRLIKHKRQITLVDYSHVQYGMMENARDVLGEFIQAAKRHKGRVKFVIKFKRRSDMWRVLWQFPNLIGSSIRLVAQGPMQQLLKQSCGVIGAGSMGLVEAYLADAAVIIPWWSDAVGHERAYFAAHVTEDEATTYFPRKPSELGELIDQVVAHKLGPKGSRQARLAQFHRFAAFDEAETASAKFTRFIQHHLAQ